MALYDVPAPAKLNLFLHVTGRRADGYHELQTVFRFIDLCDLLDFDLRSDGRVEREGESLPGLAAENDLIVRAARALQQATGTAYGAQIRCRKRIPSGAGLGGGSSDAATTLIALNRLWDTRLSRADLMALARPLGADVPIFIYGSSAFAQGIGDDFTAVDLPERSYLVLRPRLSIPTAEIFSDAGLTRNTKSVIISVFADWKTDQAQKKLQVLQEDSEGICSLDSGFNENSALKEHALKGNTLFGRNDLEAVVLAKYKPLRDMASALKSSGFHARMTGSGSCFFIEFDTQKQALRAQQEISSKMLVGGSEGQVSVQENALAQHENPLAVVEESWVCPGLSGHPLQHW